VVRVVSYSQFGLWTRPLCLPCFPALPGQSLFLEVVGAVVGLVVWPVVCLVVVLVVGLVVGLVVVVVLFVPVPPPVPPPVPVCAKVVAAEAPTRATPRTNAMTCFIHYSPSEVFQVSANVIRLSLVPAGGRDTILSPAARRQHRAAP